MVPASQPYLLMVTSFYPRGRAPIHCSFGGGAYTSTSHSSHWMPAWASPNKRVAMKTYWKYSSRAPIVPYACKTKLALNDVALACWWCFTASHASHWHLLGNHVVV